MLYETFTPLTVLFDPYIKHGNNYKKCNNGNDRYREPNSYNCKNGSYMRHLLL